MRFQDVPAGTLIRKRTGGRAVTKLANFVPDDENLVWYGARPTKGLMDGDCVFNPNEDVEVVAGDLAKA